MRCWGRWGQVRRQGVCAMSADAENQQWKQGRVDLGPLSLHTSLYLLCEMTFLGTMTSTWNVVSVQHLLQILITASKLCMLLLY